MSSKLFRDLTVEGFLALTLSYGEEHIETDWMPLPHGGRFRWLDNGVLLAEPYDQPAKGLSLVISSGVHGNETAPIEIVDELVSKLLGGDIKLAVPVLLIMGNVLAMQAQQRFINENMNRLFNGKHAGKTHYEAHRARQLEDYVQTFFRTYDAPIKRHYDLHTAIRRSHHEKFAIYPYPDGRPWNLEEINHLECCGVNAILLGHQPSSTFSYFSSHACAAYGFTVELGQVKPFGQNDMERFRAVREQLARWLSGDNIRRSPKLPQVPVYSVEKELIRRSEDFAFYVDDEVPNFTRFPVGACLMKDAEGSYVVQHEDEAIVFPNKNVPVGQRVGLIVRPVDVASVFGTLSNNH